MRIEEYVDRVRSLEGVRYEHQGRNEHELDCGGLVIFPLLEQGLPAKDLPNYKRVAHAGSLRKVVEDNCYEVSWGERSEGDIMLMWWNRRTKEGQHLAVLIRMEDGEDGMIHAYLDSKKVVRNHLGKWRKRVISVWRLNPELVER